MKYDIKDSRGKTVYTNDVVIYGDINGDGLIRAVDYMRVKKYMAGTYDFYN